MLGLGNKNRVTRHVREILEFTRPNQNIKKIRERQKHIKAIIPHKIPEVEENNLTGKQQQKSSSPLDSPSLTKNNHKNNMKYDIIQEFEK